MTKYYETRDFKKLQREWAAKLKDSGFVDIEDGLEDAQFLAGAGQVKSEPLWTAKQKVGVRGMVEVHEALDAADPAINYQSGYTASYYRAATRVAATAIRRGTDPKRSCVYVLLAEGVGDRTIQREVLELEGYALTRYAIRKYARSFRKEVLDLLDSTVL